jgi:plasmid stability protein
VATRNITFHLPDDLLREAKVYAAQHDTSVNALVKALLEEKLGKQARYRAAALRLLELAQNGPYFTADPSTIRREDIYDRFDRW